MTGKRAEDSSEAEVDGRKAETPIKGQEILHATDEPDVLESENVSDYRKMTKERSDPNDLQAERGGLKVKDSDFKIG